MCDAMYIHIPFCMNKCEYCDFLSFKSSSEERKKYVSYILKEIELYNRNKYDTIYFGGGTPSLLEGDDIKEILSKVDIGKDSEITLEVNPKSVDYKKLKEFKDAGINRISIGVQTFNENYLKVLGRLHNRDRAIETYKAAREVGFNNISIDLMFSLPNQTLEELREDLRKIVELDPEHISIYSLIWEEGTPFYEKLIKGIYKETDNDLEASMYQEIIEVLGKNNYIHYEISNFSKKGYEARHNSKYWENKEYVGIGLGASGYLENIRYKNHMDFINYYDKIDKKIKPLMEEEVVTLKEEEEYKFILGLRLLDRGVEATGRKLEVCKKLLEEGFLELKDDRYILSKKGVFLANDVFEKFLDIEEE